MPATNVQVLPGIKGRDYRFVKYGGKVYVVYDVKLFNGKRIRMSWRVNPDDFKALGVEPGRLPTISKAQHGQLAFFGDSSEIAGGDLGEHPFQKYLRQLRERHGNVSWLSDTEFMEIMLMGYAEGWSSDELRKTLTLTKWYKSRTAAERTWELEMGRADRRATIDTWVTRLTEAINDLLGPNFTLAEAGITAKQLRQRAKEIASGKWGNPAEGFEIWIADERRRLEKIEGTAAWIDRQRQIQEENAFKNQPEEMLEQLRQDAMAWLGPHAVPDLSVLEDWAKRLVAGTASEADWMQYIRGQASALYPFLGPNETWQDRASAYKRIAEETWGMPIGWDHSILSNLGALGPDGKPSGGALTYQAFTELVRSQPQFWQGPVAKEEGFALYNLLNNVFHGVSI